MLVGGKVGISKINRVDLRITHTKELHTRLPPRNDDLHKLVQNSKKILFNNKLLLGFFYAEKVTTLY